MGRDSNEHRRDIHRRDIHRDIHPSIHRRDINRVADRRWVAVPAEGGSGRHERPDGPGPSPSGDPVRKPTTRSATSPANPSGTVSRRPCTVLPLPFHDLSLPFPDRPLPFHCLAGTR